MKIVEKADKWIVLTDEGKFTFVTKEECDEFVKSIEEPKEEDLYEDDGQPDEAQEWYDFDPDA
jgi:hypothetical protein